MMHGWNTDDRTPLPGTLSNEARAAFARLGSRRCYAVGDVLISEGAYVQDLIVLHRGIVKVTARLDGENESLVDIRIAGDVVGEMAALGPGPRSATVTACGDVDATVVPGHELKPFLAANPEVWSALDTVLCSRLHRAVRRRLEFRECSVVVRLARVLVELAALYGRKGWKALIINVNLSQSEIAALTGCSTETVRKALAHLRDEGHITTGSRKTEVLDLGSLQEIAGWSVPDTS
ncbi:Crp/Fnr family transcriptional regulator [Streptomyces roseoverticillatus]|uniref:Crp/Fnr family transcriptional regulator n=1 Tax=Streptomyces roseoverticillatus TaxID=66429 RepID=UPI001F411389|nr:Crp/Fnr family transcriptional regulator [Streptomyces roseoverticillatus]